MKVRVGKGRWNAYDPAFIDHNHNSSDAENGHVSGKPAVSRRNVPVLHANSDVGNLTGLYSDLLEGQDGSHEAAVAWIRRVLHPLPRNSWRDILLLVCQLLVAELESFRLASKYADTANVTCLLELKRMSIDRLSRLLDGVAATVNSKEDLGGLKVTLYHIAVSLHHLECL